MSAARMLRRHPGVARLGVVVALLLVWEIAARWWIDPLFMAPPSRVIAGLGGMLSTQGVPTALRITLWELSIAFAISVVIGLAVGLAVGLSRFSNRSFIPIILLLYGTPQITILPLFILYFGIGPPSKIAFGVSHGIFPIIVTIVAGVQNIKPILMTAARSMGASRWQIFRWVIFPHMIPSFFAGMRLGMTGVLLGVLLAELYVSTAGIGYFTTMFTQSFNPTDLLGLISVLAAMAIILNEIVRRAEVHFGRWRME
jgi:NitT/TauT family transport system permease protein